MSRDVLYDSQRAALDALEASFTPYRHRLLTLPLREFQRAVVRTLAACEDAEGVDQVAGELRDALVDIQALLDEACPARLREVSDAQ